MSEKKTVIFYINYLVKGGAERVFVQLADRFAGAGYRSIIVTSYYDRDIEEYSVPEGVERISIEQERSTDGIIKRNYSRIKALRRLCREYRADVLISCMLEPNFRAVIASRGLGIKTVVSVCNAAEKEYGGRLGTFVGKVLMPMADGCVFQTEEEKQWFPESLQKKGRIIGNQVSESFFDVSFDGERKNIVSVGRLNPQKNQAMLIRAFARIADKTQDDLLLYGEGELREPLQGLIDELGMGERIRLMGLSSNVAEDIKGAKLFAMSSDYEGLPNAMLEAMALGLPCVVTDCAGGGPRSVIENNVNGVLTAVGDEEMLADEMLRLLKDEELRVKLGRNARAYAENFRPERVFSEWRSYVESVMG